MNIRQLLHFGIWLAAAFMSFHGAFKTGVNATGWKMNHLIRSLYYLFSDSQARRKDYSRITGSEIFPLQFCSTHWIEDVSVAELVFEIWTNICKYIGDLEKKTNLRDPQMHPRVQG